MLIAQRITPCLWFDHESPKAQRAMEAMLRMKKINIAELEHEFAR